MKRRRNTWTARPSRGRENRERNFISLTLTQCALCVGLLCAAYFLSLWQPDGYAALREDVMQALHQDVTAGEVMGWASGIDFKDRAEAVELAVGKYMAGIVYALENKESQTEASSEPAPSEGDAGANEGESGAAQVFSPVWEIPAEEAAEGASHVSEGGAGQGQGGMLPAGTQAPDTAIIAPVVLSAKLSPPVSGILTSRFGYRDHPVTNLLDFHTGIDIAAPSGTAISAALPGKVTQVGASDIYGKFVVIDHANGLQTVYCHCSKILVEEGVMVREGNRIALVGSTGISTGPHLHFELRLDGLALDPLPHLRGVSS
jgi:murein DD-endopeptidase MepM/ murein hydrolase activator NlpD